MKAVVVTASGSADVLKLADLPVPEIAEDEILIEVKAAGVNRADISQRAGHYAAPLGAPQNILGLEVAGTVVRCGSAVRQWTRGHRVCAILAGGGYAQFVAVNESHCLAIPQALSFSDAAALPEVIYTVWHNVFERGKLKTGERFLVHGGSSGVGLASIQLAKYFGAMVHATAGSDQKCAACRAAGSDTAINYRTEDFQSILKPDGVDVILDMVGGEYFEKNISILRPDGRLVFINAMKGRGAELRILEIMTRRLTITGSTLRSRDSAFKASLTNAVRQNVWPIVESGKFAPNVRKVFPLADAAEAHRLMESSQHIGKIVLVA
jgi:NADPH2:quinone reductase